MATLSYSGQRNVSDVTGISGGSPDTGEMRRKYNFAEKFTELSIDQTPFFRLVSKIGKKPTDDPNFKYTEKRQSWHKRYGYCLGDGAVDSCTNIAAGGDGNLADDHTAAGAKYLYMATDYLSQGNIQNIIGQTGKSIGSAGTRPEFYLEKQVIKINYSSTAGGSMAGYGLFQVEAVSQGMVCNDAGGDASCSLGDFKTVSEYADLNNPTASKWYEVSQLQVRVINEFPATAFLTTYNSSGAEITDASLSGEDGGVAGTSIANTLEVMRSYVVGTSYEEGSTLMEDNWADQPYSTGFGYTQIFRTEFGMTNTARATALKYEPNEWARLWRDKLIEHKWEIEQTALFGKQGSYTGVGGGTYYSTQGAVDYVLSNGNLFNLDLDSKRQDDFLEDLSQLIDPRYNNSKSMMFFCDTSTYNWLHKMGGYFQNNLEMSPNNTADFSVTGKKKSFGVDFTTISTVYGDINVARNIHLDGSGVKILGVNMSYVKWRPLVGNGMNRDTSVYVGVQGLENTGTDKRVDMILTEGGFEFKMPECHALWK
tara:strand:+ start:346 stop:1959 length:1614 start_codon:yes stop_codon:yes gene_type:complete